MTHLYQIRLIAVGLALLGIVSSARAGITVDGTLGDWGVNVQTGTTAYPTPGTGATE